MRACRAPKARRNESPTAKLGAFDSGDPKILQNVLQTFGRCASGRRIGDGANQLKNLTAPSTSSDARERSRQLWALWGAEEGVQNAVRRFDPWIATIAGRVAQIFEEVRHGDLQQNGRLIER